jgi:hypothetical protein
MKSGSGTRPINLSTLLVTPNATLEFFFFFLISNRNIYIHIKDRPYKSIYVNLSRKFLGHLISWSDFLPLTDQGGRITMRKVYCILHEKSLHMYPKLK